MESILPCYLPFGKAGEHQIRCCQGFAVNDYSFTLDALALKPSGNVGGKITSKQLPAIETKPWHVPTELMLEPGLEITRKIGVETGQSL